MTTENSTFTEQVASPAETEAPQAETQVEQEPVEQAEATQTSETPDYKGQIEQLQGEIRRLEQRAKSAEGLNRGVPTEVQAVRAEVRRLTREIGRGEIQRADLDDGERASQLQRLTDEERQEQDAERFQGHSRKLASWMNQSLERNGIEAEHPFIQERLGQWRQAQSMDDLDSVYEAIEDFIDKEKETRSMKALDEAVATERRTRQQTAREEGELAVGAPPGAPSRPLTRANADNIDSLYMAWEREHPNDPNPYEDQYGKFLATGQV